MKDLVGEIFGKWTIIKRIENDNHGKRKWLCICNCGTESNINTSDLTSGKSTKCKFCANKKDEGFIFWEHPLYATYCGMKQRCYDKNTLAYKNYGKRGIKVCDRWAKRMGFINFIKDMGERPKGCTLERKDNNGEYSPKNCVWATGIQQANNKREKVFYKEVSYKSLRDLANKSGINVNTFYSRLYAGWSLEDAVETKVM